MIEAAVHHYPATSWPCCKNTMPPLQFGLEGYNVITPAANYRVSIKGVFTGKTIALTQPSQPRSQR